MSDPFAVFREAAEMVASLPPRPKWFMASHAVPYGRVYRQWNTRGELLVWVNRGQIADLPCHNPDRHGIGPYVIDPVMLSAIPVVNA